MTSPFRTAPLWDIQCSSFTAITNHVATLHVPLAPTLSHHCCFTLLLKLNVLFFFVVEVQPLISVVNGNVGKTTSLTCDMSGYIHPDADFQWRRGGQMITANEKYSITYIDGFADKGVNGEKVSSRYSSLTISDVIDSDEGNYTCFIEGTDLEASVLLSVTGRNLIIHSCAYVVHEVEFRCINLQAKVTHLKMFHIALASYLA